MEHLNIASTRGYITRLEDKSPSRPPRHCLSPLHMCEMTNKICILHCLLVVYLLDCTAVNHLNINYLSLMMVFVMIFAGYISQVLKNYSDHACDGEYVSLRCPHRTTISIQSSFYGRIVPSHQMCPSRYPHSYATLIKEDVACSVGTSLQVLNVKLDLLILDFIFPWPGSSFLFWCCIALH